MARRLLVASPFAVGLMLVLAAPALACGGLVAPGHAEVLQKATTLAAWHDGLEHYVTGFQFAGGADRFGYIVPLPGVPTKIQKGGNWTLERLEREINPIQIVALAASAPVAYDRVAVLQRVKIDALDIVVVRGGGPDVAAWAERNGFDLTPDTPRVLSAYSSQGAIFALARFDRAAAVEKGLIQGQGTVIQFTIPTKAPWIPLRILALGKQGSELVEADLFVLTDHRPWFAPGLSSMPGLQLRQQGWANDQLLTDLRSDRRMGWVPAKGMWLTAMTLHTTAAAIRSDLSIDGGLPAGAVLTEGPAPTPAWTWLIIALLGVATVAGWAIWRPDRPRLRAA